MKKTRLGRVMGYLAVSACVGLFCVPVAAVDPDSGDEVLSFMQQKAGEIKTLSADMTITMTVPYRPGEPQSMNTKVKLLMRKPDLMRAEAQVRMRDREMETLTVSDGKIMWTEQKMGGLTAVMKMDLAAAKEMGGQAAASSDLGWDQFANAEEVKKLFEIRSLGKKTIGDVETYGLELVPKGEGGTNLKGYIPLGLSQETLGAIRLYLDVKTGVPVRTVYLKKDDSIFRTMDCTNVKINPELDDKLFTYTAPEGVEVTDVTEIMKAVYQQTRPQE